MQRCEALDPSKFGIMTDDGFIANPEFPEFRYEEQPKAVRNETAGRWEIHFSDGFAGQLPGAVVYNAVLDITQGIEMKEYRRILMTEKGLTREEAEALLYPTPDHGGCAFYEAWNRMRAHIMFPHMGAAARFWSDFHEPFFKRLYLWRVLLALSGANGGGPGVMLQASRLTAEWERIVSTLKLIRICSSSKVAQVFLQIQKERPNGWGSPGFMVRPFNWVPGRGQMLFSPPNVDSYGFDAGGFGTESEQADIPLSDQLYTETITSMAIKRPMLWFDYELSTGKRRCDPIYETFENQLRDNMIRPSHLARMHRIHIDRPDSLRHAFGIQCRSVAEIIGCDPIAWWEAKNQRDFFAYADSVYDEFGSQIAEPHMTKAEAIAARDTVAV